MKFILALLSVVIAFVASFFLTAGIIKLICWAFSLTFSLKIVFGIWLVMLLINAVVKK